MEQPLEGFTLLGLRDDLIARELGGELAVVADDTTDQAHSILELEVIGLHNGQIKALLLTAIGVVGDPLGEVRLDEGKVLHRQLSRLDGVITQVFGAHRRVDSIARLGGIAVAWIACLLIDASNEFLGFGSRIAPEVEVTIAPVDSEEVVRTELVVDESYPLIRGLRQIVVACAIEDGGSQAVVLSELR